MAKISSYPAISVPSLDDILIGTDIANNNATKNFKLSDVISLIGSSLSTYANNSAALSGGLTVGSLYKTAAGEVRVVV
jgi:hypothetical protein